MRGFIDHDQVRVLENDRERSILPFFLRHDNGWSALEQPHLIDDAGHTGDTTDSLDDGAALCFIPEYAGKGHRPHLDRGRERSSSGPYQSFTDGLGQFSIRGSASTEHA
jgi:hypothetical protein